MLFSLKSLVSPLLIRLIIWKGVRIKQESDNMQKQGAPSQRKMQDKYIL